MKCPECKNELMESEHSTHPKNCSNQAGQFINNTSQKYCLRCGYTAPEVRTRSYLRFGKVTGTYIV